MTSDLRQVAIHSESVGSQLVIHVRVFSTHNSVQTSLSSKSLKTITWLYFNLNLTVRTDNSDPSIDRLCEKTLGQVRITRRLSFWIFQLFQFVSNKTNSRCFPMQIKLFHWHVDKGGLSDPAFSSWREPHDHLFKKVMRTRWSYSEMLCTKCFVQSIIFNRVLIFIKYVTYCMYHFVCFIRTAKFSFYTS